MVSNGEVKGKGGRRVELEELQNRTINRTLKETQSVPELRLSSLGEKIFLDRYALKDPLVALKDGDLVLYRDADTKQKEIGRVVGSPNGTVLVCSTCGEAKEREFRREELDRPIENISAALTRVAAAAAGKSDELFKEFSWLLDGPRFIPAGRILESLGSGQGTTGMNCFVLPSPRDSRDGIFSTLANMAELMCKGGGVGINYSTLRPENSYVAGVNGRSSGAVSWLELFSYVTNLIIQGGSRRGAQMAMLADWHPDIYKFIDLKREQGRATGCNMSVVISDKFMRTVKEDGNWDLMFPDTAHRAYNQEWDGDIQVWKAKGYPVTVWKTIRAAHLWNSIIASAHACAEPGLWFQDRANNARPGGGALIATNPCAEQGLPPYGVCNLGHLVFPSFVTRNAWECDEKVGSFNSELCMKAARAGIRFLDKVIDFASYPLPQTEEVQFRERRVGLGTVGLGEALIRMGYRYGGTLAKRWASNQYRNIALSVYDESSDMALEMGAAPAWDKDLFAKSTFGATIKRDAMTLFNKIMDTGMRNVCCLTQAPTGTVGTMLGTSTGIEPFYAWETERKGRLGTHIERPAVVEEYLEHTNNVGKTTLLPDYFVSAMELTPAEHVDMQATVQEWTDASISKTINCPEHWTPAQIGEVYQMLYDSGCKGGTVYRDNCRSIQVLTAIETKPDPKPEHKVPKKPEHNDPVPPAKRDPVPIHPRPSYPAVRPSVTASKATPGGVVHVTLTRCPEAGAPLEVFCEAGRSGSEVKALMEAMGRLMTLALRVSEETPEERLALMIGQLKGIGGNQSIGFGPARVLSIPDGIAGALEQAAHYASTAILPDAATSRNMDVCPACQELSLRRDGGCELCPCGYSRC